MSEGLRLISAIISAGSGNTLTRMNRDEFTVPEQGVYDFVLDHYRRYHEMPEATTVQTELATRLPASPEPLQFYLDQVSDRFIFNNVRESYAELRDGLRDRDIESMRPIIENMYNAVRTRQQSGQTVMNIGEALGLVQDRLIATRGMGGITGIETPWPTFNEITGGYQNADLVTIVGRPGVAKTYNILTQAISAHDNGHSVLVVTTEMGIEQLARRYVALKIGVNPDLLKRNMIGTYVSRQIDSLRVEMMADTRFRIMSVGMGAKISSIEALLQDYGPSICYLDGTYLMHPSVKAQMKRIERVAEVFDELKGLTISADIPIVNTMQFNRQAGAGGKEGTLENIGFTDAVAMHSSLVIGLKYGPTENPRASRTMEFMKGREGEVGDVHMNFRFAPVDMSELVMESATRADGTPVSDGVDVDWMV